MLVVATLLAGVTLLVPPRAIAYVEGPPPGNTGGFGEQSCLQCHFDGPLNDPDGSLRLEGVPESYVPGDEYRIDIVLVRSDIRRGGFELAVRFAQLSDYEVNLEDPKSNSRRRVHRLPAQKP